METIFEVGDRVFHIRYKWDYILCTNETECYLKCASKWVKNDELSFTEYTLKGFSQERPRKEPEIGNLCLFTDNEDSFKNNIGCIVGILEKVYDRRDYTYKMKDGGSYEFCKQIEIKGV